MAIIGPLAFRANKWSSHHDLKTGQKKTVVTSPLHNTFVWEDSVVWSTCQSGCPLDEEGHVVSRKNCSCGIYATVKPDVLKDYFTSVNTVVCMVEALGNSTDLGTWGFTASGVQVVGVVNVTTYGAYLKNIEKNGGNRVLSVHGKSILLMGQYFGVPVLPWDLALEMAKIQWEKHGMEWPNFGGF